MDGLFTLCQQPDWIVGHFVPCWYDGRISKFLRSILTSDVIDDYLTAGQWAKFNTALSWFRVVLLLYPFFILLTVL
jgi:hypothetical protein